MYFAINIQSYFQAGRTTGADENKKVRFVWLDLHQLAIE